MHEHEHLDLSTFVRICMHLGLILHPELSVLKLEINLGSHKIELLKTVFKSDIATIIYSYTGMWQLMTD